MEVRVARSADADRLSGLIGVMGYAVSSELVEGKLADLGDDHRVLVAEDHQRIVGWAHVYIDRTLYGPAVAQLAGLAVHPEETRRGVGGALLDVVEGWASERGCVAVWARSGEHRAPAHRFYRGRGYQDLKRQVVLVKPLADYIADPRLRPASDALDAPNPVEACVFCDQVADDEQIIAYRDDHTMAFPPLQQLATNRGHMLVATTAHIRDLDELPGHLAAPVLSTVRRIAAAVRDSTGATGTSIRQNNGPPAQDVFHLHFHVIPRFDHPDDLRGDWQTMSRQDQLDAADRVRRALGTAWMNDEHHRARFDTPQDG